MRRDLLELTGQVYDLLVIGGGVYGACVAWDAALRGLSVALVEKGDFGAATSANSLKIIHGGLRYLQHADFRRMRESICERRTLMQIAPHLVHPLPFLIPTHHRLFRGKGALSLALALNDAVGCDRNRLADAERRLPRGRIVSRSEYLASCPGANGEGVTGGALWYDCQVRNSERLLLSFLRAAVAAGANVANYVEVTGFQRQGNRVTGVKANDVCTGSALEVRANVVVNAAGPWVDHVLGFLGGRRPGHALSLSKAMNLVVNRSLVRGRAVGVYGTRTFQDDDALVSRGSRLFFITPWRHLSLIGTAHLPYHGDPDAFAATEEDVQNFLDEVNEAYPAAAVKREEVVMVHRGLLPMDGVNSATGDVRLAKQHRVRDHLQEEGIDGLISVVGVKYTTARHVAQRAVDLVFHKLGKGPPRCRTAAVPVYGGEIGRLNEFVKAEAAKHARRLTAKTVQHLIYNYGAAYPAILKYAEKNPGLTQPLTPTSPVLKAEVVHAVRDEMALRLSDVVLRRTELGLAGDPGERCLSACAEIMAAELGWGDTQKRKEIAEAKAVFSSLGAVLSKSDVTSAFSMLDSPGACSTSMSACDRESPRGLAMPKEGL